jgi:CheY-like chemotaxis protein
MRSIKPILLLEDDAVDVMTVKRAMKDLSVANTLVRTVNGEEGLKYLQDSANVKPCVILLDLNMPKMNGAEFLKVAKADPQLRGIPVVVLTTSKADQDKIECFNHSVAGYIVKPVDYKGFVDAIKILNLYWTLNELPGSAAETTDVKLEKSVCAQQA